MRLLLVLTIAAALGAQTAQTIGNVQNGKKIFDSYGCYQCHGHDGHGGAGARLAPNPISFTAFSKYVRQPTGEMPPYTAKVVSDQELADIYAFLHSLPAPPPVKNIPLLNN
jgi:mono/diheme cytochrome c family protein